MKAETELDLGPSGTLKVVFWAPGSEVAAAADDGARIDPSALNVPLVAGFGSTVTDPVSDGAPVEANIVTSVAGSEAAAAVNVGAPVDPSTASDAGPSAVTNVDATSASTAAAIAEARKDVGTLSTRTSDRLAAGVDAAQGIVESSTPLFGALGDVLDKIDIFVKIGDEVANVRSRSSFALRI